MKRVSWLITGVAVTLIAFLYYGRFLNNFFVFDDFRYLENIITGSQPETLI